MTRIAWFSPIDLDRPLYSAVCTRLLVPALAPRFDIEVFVDDEDLDRAGENSICPANKVFHYHRYFERDAANPFNLAIYQIEDDPRLSYCYRFQRLVPGLTLRHDLNLNRMFLGAYKHSTGGTDIDLETAELFGPAAVKLGQYAVRGWSLELFDRLYRRGETGPARFNASIVHDPGAYQSVRRDDPTSKTYLLRPPAAVELFNPANSAPNSGPKSNGRFVLGLTSGRELENRAGWCAEIIEKLAGEVSVVWCLHKDRIDHSVRSIIERCSKLTDISIVETGSTEEYFKQIAGFDLYLAPVLSAGRSIPLELAFARSCGVPTLVSSYESAAELEADPGVLVLSPERSNETELAAKAIRRIAAACQDRPAQRIAPPPPTDNPYELRFEKILTEVLQSGALRREQRDAQRLNARSGLHKQILAESPSSGLNANYRELVNRTLFSGS